MCEEHSRLICLRRPRPFRVTATLGFALWVFQAGAVDAATPDGAAVFARACASCHQGGDPRAPARDVLAQRSPEAILSALTAGLMRPQGARIDALERRAVAEFISGKSLGGDVTGASIGRCTAQPPFPGSSHSLVGPAGAVQCATHASNPRIKLALLLNRFRISH